MQTLPLLTQPLCTVQQQQQQGDLLSVMELGNTLTGTQVKFHC